MKKIQLLILIFTGIIAVYTMFLIDNRNIGYEVQIFSDGISEPIKSWYDEESEINYVFLPSYTTVGTLTYDENIVSKEDVVFVQSANVSTIYLTTATGKMDEVYEEKSHIEPVSIVIYSEDGKVEYQGNDVELKAHGNYTLHADKKPFKLLFKDSISLKALGEGTEWILLANAYDDTNLKNAIVTEVAKNVGIEAVSNYRYVDVYLNGEYNGLYTLVQDVPDTLIDSFGDENIYLAEVNSSGATDLSVEVDSSGEEVLNESGNYFRINDYAIAELELPEEITDERLEEIQNWFQNTDAVITGKKEGELEDYIDIDSWSKKYLIDEIFENFDSGIRSNYFYWNSENGSISQIFAGPLWDYDITCGTAGKPIEDPAILYAAQFERSSDTNILWYGNLYRNEEFYNSIVQKYQDEFRDILIQMTESDINNLAYKIQQAVDANNIRWKISDSQDYEELISWLKSRIEFLDSVWLEKNSYVVVTIDRGEDSGYYRCYLKEGECLKEHPMFETYFGDSDSEWKNKLTDEEVNFSTPLYEDITVVDVHSSTESIITKIYNHKNLLSALMLVGWLGASIMILLVMDFRRNG